MSADKVSGMKARMIRLLSLIVTVVTFGCAVGPDFVRPEAPSVDRYIHASQPDVTAAADDVAQRFVIGASVAPDWWRLFDSPMMDELMQEAMANNRTVEAAQARLRQSQNILRAGYGVFYPQVGGTFDWARSKTAQTPAPRTHPTGVFNLYTFAGAVSYAIDAFGGNRRAVESLQAQLDTQRHSVAGTYLSLSGNIVNAVIAAAAYHAMIESTEQIVEAEREQIRISESQAEAGLVPYVNVLSIKAQMSATEATIPQLRQKAAQAEHLLAVLTGRLPGEWAPPKIDLAALKLPADLPLSVPSELVRQRPDVLMAEERLHSASAGIGVATAAFFPSFTLHGDYGMSSTSLGHLFGPAGTFWSLGANVAAPLFQGGALWFRREAAIEAYNEALALYRQTVLDAFAQVADVLRALEYDAQVVRLRSQALATAEETMKLVQANHEAGLANYLQVLVANGQYHQAKIGYLQARTQRLQDTAALFVALGGGWRGAK